MAKIKDMTQGSPAKLIFTFALPLMLGNIFQQLYTVVDTAIVGQFVGVEALAAIGSADWPNWMILGIVTGFAQGFCILISQRFGAGDGVGMKRAVSHTYVLGLVMGVLLTLLGHAVIRPILTMLGTPEDIYGGAETYLRISYTGILIVMAYNVLSSVLRALGDSKTPLIAMVIASITNIVLDLLFVRVFCWGIAGAAVATLLAQVVSAVYCWMIIRRIELIRLHKEDFAWDRYTAGKLLRLGAPMAFQNGIIAVGGFAVQYVLNGFGTIYIAGYTATNKLYGILEIAAISYGYSMATYAGQNLGAGKLDRIKKGMTAGAWMALVTSAVISALMLLFGRNILSMFISGQHTKQVLDVAYTYLSIMAWLLSILYFLHVYRSALQGMGDTLMPMISGFVELVMRVGVALSLSGLIREYALYLAEPAAWFGAAVLLITCYYVRVHKLSKTGIAKENI